MNTAVHTYTPHSRSTWFEGLEVAVVFPETVPRTNLRGLFQTVDKMNSRMIGTSQTVDKPTIVQN